MARECFCGCGRRIPKFPLGMRAMNKRGRQVSERLSLVEDENSHMIDENEEIAAWVEAGQGFRSELVAAMHGELDPSLVAETPIREWQAEGRNIERFIKRQVAALGRWIRQEGWTPEQAIEEINRGARPPWTENSWTGDDIDSGSEPSGPSRQETREAAERLGVKLTSAEAAAYDAGELDDDSSEDEGRA
jgi:hypothetical protein